MNNLNSKINRNLINIVNDYLLPNKETLRGKKYLYLNNLQNSTVFINDQLYINDGCYDYNGKNFINGFKNTEIRHITKSNIKNHYPNYWIIRKKLQ